MSDVIKLLPEAIANQIAAGEVIQRPASVVKELLENAIDAKASTIKLIIKNAGKTLIQVIDNGVGMSDTDARMSFERHATSKIKKTDDLFNIRTMGFRGEALASMASIAEVEMKTRQLQSDIATRLVVKSSEVVEQGYCQAEPGTSISVKHLFYNIPARKKFLKSDSVELKHLLNEFKKVALAHPEVGFTVLHNDNELYNLPEGSLKKRLLNLFRRTYEDKLIRIEEETGVVSITGFIGDPDISKKVRDEQYLFVNKRYFKSNYLNHAVRTAYQNLNEEGQHPFHVLFLEVDPGSIDINIHPSKHEVKFDDERLIYNYLKVAVRHGLGRYSLSPQLDFENQNQSLPQQRREKDHNPMLASRVRTAPIKRGWQNLYSDMEIMDISEDKQDPSGEEPLILASAATGDLLSEHLDTEVKKPSQLHNAYILVQIKSGMIIMDQHRAHRRVLYEQYLRNLDNNPESIQKQLFPITLTVDKDKVAMLTELAPSLRPLGFEVEAFGGETFIVHGIPAGLTENNIPSIIEKLLDQYVQNLNLDYSKNENLARSLAKSSAIRNGQVLSTEEMSTLINELFACQYPYTEPGGKKCFITFELKDVEKMFS